MDSHTLSYLQELMQIAARSDHSRNNIEKFIVALRKEFVFDNVAVYLQDETTQMLADTAHRLFGDALEDRRRHGAAVRGHPAVRGVDDDDDGQLRSA